MDFETRVITLIRSSKDPAQALRDAMQLLTEFLSASSGERNTTPVPPQVSA